ncbi:MAG: MBL fold metallo-hydrolase [Flavobacteriaceae bacterium]
MQIYPIEAGHFKLDGGAMFGVVPKTIWNKTNPADQNNRIEMASRCLLVEDKDRLILIDSGMGTKQSDKFFSYYDRWGEYDLEKSIRQAGFHPDEITDVFFTHLHFDHCGGAFYRNAEGKIIPLFKNAHYWVHQNHWEWATNPNPREKASFLTENLMPIQESGQLHLISDQGNRIQTPLGFDVFLMDGHTEKQMLPILEYKDRTIVYAADLIPTVGHIPVPYLMGYDVRPLQTMREKADFLKMAVDNDFLLLLEHDPYHELISLQTTERGVRLDNHAPFGDYFSK